MLRNQFAGLLGLVVLQGAFAKIDQSDFAPADIIERDVAVVGGGAAGSHAAVRIREYYRRSVVIIEKEGNLGGHVNTYQDPKTGNIQDYGVAMYFPYQDALDFFTWMNVNISLTFPANQDNPKIYADFSTGQQLVNFTEIERSQGLEAIAKFVNLTIEKGYDQMVQPGYTNLPPGKDIPEDLLLPLGEFVKKYDIETMLPFIYSSTGSGVGSRGYFTKLLTLTFLKAFPPGWARAYLGEIPIYAVDGGNQVLYNEIATLMRRDVLFNSTVIESSRAAGKIELVAQSSDGTKKLILAKKLLIAVPPTRENLAPFDLDEAERVHFSKTKYGRSHTALISHSKLPEANLVNTPESASQSPITPFLQTPFVIGFTYVKAFGDAKVFQISAAGDNYTAFDVPAAQAAVQDALEKLAEKGTIPDLEGEKVKIVSWDDNGPGGFGVSAEDLRAGWMEDMYKMQGKRGTWYTGNGLGADFTVMLWKFNDGLLGGLIRA
ncbi:hypothetical protein QBC38DRAFT_367640 [Podospora fimiseda]|uniref:Amine oxidase domain-containing protein n=1 Tax=Podospora fimiseda TaxID=252190 RepID=A0AAN7H1Q7_9PEZI|nr:hypothetical protein QBC38DRAFT_367640 [Podospora fimiseda]